MKMISTCIDGVINISIDCFLNGHIKTIFVNKSSIDDDDERAIRNTFHHLNNTK